jgi:hypothetical protein
MAIGPLNTPPVDLPSPSEDKNTADLRAPATDDAARFKSLMAEAEPAPEEEKAPDKLSEYGGYGVDDARELTDAEKQHQVWINAMLATTQATESSVRTELLREGDRLRAEIEKAFKGG